MPSEFIHDDRFVLVTREQYGALLWKFDVSMYDWGHCGDIYYLGRRVVHINTIGM